MPSIVTDVNGEQVSPTPTDRALWNPWIVAVATDGDHRSKHPEWAAVAATLLVVK